MTRRAVELGPGPGAASSSLCSVGLAFATPVDISNTDGEDFGIAGGGDVGGALCGTFAVNCAIAASAIEIETGATPVASNPTCSGRRSGKDMSVVPQPGRFELDSCSVETSLG